MNPSGIKEVPLYVGKKGLSLPNSSLIELLQAVLSSRLRFRLQVKGSSMSPFIRDGDVVTIARQHFLRSYNYGRVVAFIHPQNGRLMIHRVVGRKGGSYLTQGDNVSGADGLLSPDRILGHITCAERDGMRVFIGFGPERFLIAFLSRQRLLSSLTLFIWRTLCPIRKGWTK